MDNLEKDKYIVLYLDRNKEYEEYNKIYGVFSKLHQPAASPAAPHPEQALLGSAEIYGLKIVHFLLNYENKQKNKEELNNKLLIQIYQDDYIEEYIIKECFCIIYCSKFKRSKNLIDLLLKYDKNIINFDNIENMLDKHNGVFRKLHQPATSQEAPHPGYSISEDRVEYKRDGDIQSLLGSAENIGIFAEYYKNLPDLENIYQKKDDLNKNIKLILNKKIKEKNVDEYQNSDKIHLITYYKETDIKLLNIIQKKCIFENYKNKSIIKLLIIGKNLIEEFKEILEYDTNKKIILHDISSSDKENISFKYLIDISNTIFLNKIICILRSDIILPNQNELDDLEFDLLSDKKQVFSVSRIERLINGNLVKSDKLHKILNCTEQDAWFFKSPLNIGDGVFRKLHQPAPSPSASHPEQHLTGADENNIKLDMINFYDKYSELYFNNILKDEGYNIINNTKKYKIIRLLYENNIENRPLLNIGDAPHIKNNLEKICLLPDNNSVDKISIDQILSSCKLDEREMYYIKCELINKYFKNKIFI